MTEWRIRPRSGGEAKTEAKFQPVKKAKSVVAAAAAGAKQQAAGSQEGGQQQKGGQQQDKHHALMTSVVKGGLWSMQQIRLLQGTAWTT